MELKTVSLNEHKYKKYGSNSYYIHNETFTYSHTPKRDIRKEMIKGYMCLLSKRIN